MKLLLFNSFRIIDLDNCNLLSRRRSWFSGRNIKPNGHNLSVVGIKASFLDEEKNITGIE
jgi:hypothetical protein